MQPKGYPQTNVWFNRLLLPAFLAIVAITLIVTGMTRATDTGKRASPGPHDPLSAHERAIAQAQLAKTGMDTQASSAGSEAFADGEVAADKQAASAPERQIILTIDHHQPSKDELARGNPPRQAEATIYHYSTNTLQRVLIDLEASESGVSSAGVEAIHVLETVQDVQLPLAASEEAMALTLIRQDELAWQTLREQFQTMSGAELTSLDQLDTKIVIFKADAMPNRINQASSHCGRHRCAQVLLFTRDRFAFELSPIVDLSTQTIAQLFWVE